MNKNFYYGSSDNQNTQYVIMAIFGIKQALGFVTSDGPCVKNKIYEIYVFV